MPFKNLPLSFSFAESTVLRLKVDCKPFFFVVILNGICLLTLNIKVNTLKENQNCNYKHSLRKSLSRDHFCNKRKVEMRKNDSVYQLQKNADTAGDEAMREQFRRCCLTTVL